jgi:hypothetical protein
MVVGGGGGGGTVVAAAAVEAFVARSRRSQSNPGKKFPRSVAVIPRPSFEYQM